MFGFSIPAHIIAAMAESLARLSDASALDLGPDDAAYAECIDSVLPQMTLIGPDAGNALRALVYG